MILIKYIYVYTLAEKNMDNRIIEAKLSAMGVFTFKFYKVR